MWPHTVAILIGGQSERMGRPKHLVTLPNGKTMLEMMLEFASSVGNKTIILGGEVDGEHCIQDLRKQQGPVAGIEAMLHSEFDTTYLVVGCDMPTLTKIAVAPLLNCTNNSIFSYENKVLGLPLCINAEYLSQCSAYLDSGGRSIWEFVTQIPHTSIPLSKSESSSFLSINLPDDLDNLTFK
jgi:molybdopterin-guanine dinucleotide biosynthesis protein A